MLIQYLVSASRMSLRQTLGLAPTVLVPTMLLVACGRQESKPAATPGAATTTTATAALGPGEGLLPVRGGRIWYRVSGTGKGTPMVLLHGGPGAGSYYLDPESASQGVEFLDEARNAHQRRVGEPIRLPCTQLVIPDDGPIVTDILEGLEIVAPGPGPSV